MRDEVKPQTAMQLMDATLAEHEMTSRTAAIRGLEAARVNYDDVLKRVEEANAYARARSELLV